MSEQLIQNKIRLRIAMLGHKRVPSREGGVEVVVGELSSRMARRGHQVTCYNRGYSQGTVQGTDLKDPDRDGKSFHSFRLKNVPTINIKGAAAVTAAFSPSRMTEDASRPHLAL